MAEPSQEHYTELKERELHNCSIKTWPFLFFSLGLLTYALVTTKSEFRGLLCYRAKLFSQWKQRLLLAPKLKLPCHI